MLQDCVKCRNHYLIWYYERLHITIWEISEAYLFFSAILAGYTVEAR